MNMMKLFRKDDKVKIQSRFKEYEVIFEDNKVFLRDLVSKPNSEIVVDKNVYELYKDCFEEIPSERLFVVEATEKNKVVDTALDICEKITEIPAKRNATLISIGGGIIQDITGFVANVTYRGINWIFVPTTLLAACDSCIGGKTSLNYKKYKNLLGTFYPPDEIHICSEMFHTLTERDFNAIEVITEYEIPHGTAVAIGMIMANSISEKRGLISSDVVKRSEKVLLEVIDIDSKLLDKPLEDYMKAIRKDKKQVSESLTAVLISNYGENGELSVVHDVTEQEIDYAINYFKKLYRA